MDDFDKIAAQANMLPEELALTTILEFFGPLTPGFLEHTCDEKWQNALKRLQEMIEENYDPKHRFEAWTLEDFPRMTPEVKDLVGRIVKLDPKERPSMRQVMQHPSWGNEGSGDAADATV